MNLIRSTTLIVTVTAAAAWMQPQDDFKITANAELVLLDAGVEDRNGQHVPNLTKDSFEVYENGRRQTISHFASEDVPVAVGLVMDNSGSMRSKRAEVVTAALEFIRASNHHDDVFVTNFNDSARLGLPKNLAFSSDVQKLRAALSDSRPEGRTILYDALLLSLTQLELSKLARKALVLVSDGGDNASAHNLRDVMAAVRKSRATIYTIGIFDEDDRDRNPAELRRLARESGGQFYFPNQVSDVVEVCRRIATDIRNRYTLGYVPNRDGSMKALRTLKVSAVGPDRQRLAVHVRTSYVLPESPGREP